MVETSLRGRPGTYLQSEASTGGDSLTYYDYQRYLRSQKVALLQERRANTHIPGYKKIVLSKSRTVFQTKNRTPTHTINGEVQPNNEHSKLNPISSTKELITSKGSALSPTHMPSPSTKMNVIWKSDDPKYSEIDRLPRIAARYRPIKSATARDHYVAHPESEQHLLRPKSVAGDRSTDAHTYEVTVKEKEYPSTSPPEDEQPGPQLLHRHAWSEDEQIEDLENAEHILTKRDALANAFTWGTTTQSAYDEVDWAQRVAIPVQPPMNTLEPFPDPVSQRLTFRRYHSEPAGWQIYGSEWDYIQTRAGTFPKGPLAINYCNSTKRTCQIPGYLGCIPSHENMDNPSVHFQPALLIRSLKPRPTNIARKMNIPGYTGHVHWARTTSVPAKPSAWYNTSERSHGQLPQEDDTSPFCRNGVFSRIITTVSPHNPFNKIEF